MQVIVFDDPVSDLVAPGVTCSRLEPGGKDGPGGIVRDSDQPGGATWSQIWSLGAARGRLAACRSLTSGWHRIRFGPCIGMIAGP